MFPFLDRCSLDYNIQMSPVFQLPWLLRAAVAVTGGKKKKKILKLNVTNCENCRIRTSAKCSSESPRRQSSHPG